MAKTKDQIEVARLTDLLDRRNEEARRDRELHELVVKGFEARLTAHREERRRLTQTVEALARRCDEAEHYGHAPQTVLL